MSQNDHKQYKKYYTLFHSINNEMDNEMVKVDWFCSKYAIYLGQKHLASQIIAACLHSAGNQRVVELPCLLLKEYK